MFPAAAGTFFIEQMCVWHLVSCIRFHGVRPAAAGTLLSQKWCSSDSVTCIRLGEVFLADASAFLFCQNDLQMGLAISLAVEARSLRTQEKGQHSQMALALAVADF